MSGTERPEIRAFRELETLVRHLGEELAAFRRRAIQAEAQLKDAAPSHGKRGAPATAKPSELEAENEQLRRRLASAEDRVRQMMDRVRFLRQQVQSQPHGTGAGHA